MPRTHVPASSRPRATWDSERSAHVPGPRPPGPGSSSEVRGARIVTPLGVSQVLGLSVPGPLAVQGRPAVSPAGPASRHQRGGLLEARRLVRAPGAGRQAGVRGEGSLGWFQGARADCMLKEAAQLHPGSTRAAPPTRAVMAVVAKCSCAVQAPGAGRQSGMRG
jgi:hypothetical protein